MKKYDLTCSIVDLENAKRIQMLVLSLLQALPIEGKDNHLVMVVGEGHEKNNEEALCNWVMRELSSANRSPEAGNLVWLGGQLVDYIDDRLRDISGGIYCI